jgi:hypothetical protein
MKILHACAFTLLYVAVLLVVYLVHARYFPVEVVFYSAIGDAVLAALVVASVLGLLVPRGPLGAFEKALLIIIWLLGGYAFAISVPTVIDRSLSFYLLEKLQQRGGGIWYAQFSDVFVNEYMPEFHLVGVRLTEQLQSGTIIIDNGCVKLTPLGKRIATFSRYFREHFLPRHRLLMGSYSDALTHPFAADYSPQRGYECE